MHTKTAEPKQTRKKTGFTIVACSLYALFCFVLHYTAHDVVASKKGTTSIETIVFQDETA